MPPPRRTMKRPLLRAAAFALAGLLTALAVAFVGPLLLPRPDPMTPFVHPKKKRISRVWSYTYIGALGRAEGEPASNAARFGALARNPGREPWPPPLSEPPGLDSYQWEVYESGWPATMLWGWAFCQRIGDRADEEAQAGLVRVPRLGADPWKQRATFLLPLLPHWRGVAINTVTFGAAWWALFALAGPSRRVTRRRRGLCPSCTYPRAGLAAEAACPECGGLSAPSTTR